MIRAGKHLYERCGYCGTLVRQTGWFAGWHVCLDDEERERIDKRVAEAKAKRRRR